MDVWPLAADVACCWPAPRRFLQAWLWRVEGQDVFFEKNLPLRFKVQTVRFHPVPTLAEQQEQVGGWLAHWEPAWGAAAVS
jgi:hypothetical protein